GMNEMITVKRYLDRLGGSPPLVFCVFNNQDLNQVTWEQRAMAGDPKFGGSQDIPDVPYHKYAELLGLRGIYCDDPGQVGKAWDEALASDVPVVLEFKTDPEIPPLPPHIMSSQAKESAKAALHDPQRMGLATHGFRQKVAEIFEKLPGRDDK
ncbi:MAG TPA: thiamine pyrophosphate-dependent enzyme, partial [Streptosporangiaceae bacterium]|nr:thiamine pyrophosphate-dependent enzyme [Streptosporangiaceae bacterium]